MTRFLAAVAFLIALACPAAAQNFTCPDVPNGDSSNRCANTRFVMTNGGGGGTSALTNNHIFIGNASNVATDTAMTGDCTIVFAGGAITCFASAPLPTSRGGTGLNAGASSGVPLFATGAVTFVPTTGTGDFVRGSGAAIASAAISASAWTGGTITGLPTCSAVSDACPKSYIDSVSGGNTPLAPVRLATVAVLSNTPTYANGAAGVGATLTAGSNGALSVDGTVVNLNDRVLVKDQAAQLQNGPYSLTTLGTGGVPYVLTRTTDADTAAELPNRLTTLVTAGATLGGSSWTLNQAAAITVGTTALPFVQTASPSVSYWTLSGSDIFSNNAGNVGIGTSAPATTLDVLGALTTRRAGTDSGGTLNLGHGAGAWTIIGNQAAGFDLEVKNPAGGIPLYFAQTGNLIGLNSTTSPRSILDFGTSTNAQQMLLYSDGTNNRFGWGIQSSELRTFVPTNTRMTFGEISTANGTTFTESMRFLPTTGTLGIGTTAPDLTKKMQVIQGTVGVPVTTVANAVQIVRTEQLASPNDTQGGQNAALDVYSVGYDTSVPGVNIAQPVGIKGAAYQKGSGDSVGVFGAAVNDGTGTYAAFGGFLFAQANTASTGAVGLGLAVDNSSGVARPFALSGGLYFVGVDSPCSGNATCSAAFISRNAGQAWDVGFGVQNGSVVSAAFRSLNFSVDPSGNEVALSNTAISDERLKDIHGPFTKGLAEILRINPILYNWKDKPDQARQAGVSAQDVQRAIPEAVSTIDDEGHLGVSDRPLVAALINSVKELKAANDNLKACQASWRCRIFGP